MRIYIVLIDKRKNLHYNLESEKRISIIIFSLCVLWIADGM